MTSPEAAPGCPRCPQGVTAQGTGWVCPDHGRVVPLWRAAHADYENLAEHLLRSSGMPTYLPWPLTSRWSITAFGCVADDERVRATAATCTGVSQPDGPVEVTVVAEEPGVGLGARIAGTDHTDPGAEVGKGPAHVRVRVDNKPVGLWAVSVPSDEPLDRSVFAGEAHGRWLWLVLRPASAALLLRDEWLLQDVAEAGPELIEMSFGGTPPVW